MKKRFIKFTSAAATALVLAGAAAPVFASTITVAESFDTLEAALEAYPDSNPMSENGKFIVYVEKSELDLAKEALEEAQAKVDELEASLAAKEEELAALEAQRAELGEVSEDAIAELEVAQAELEAAQAELQPFADEIAGVLAEIEATEDEVELGGLHAYLGGLEVEAAPYEAEVERLEAVVADLTPAAEQAEQAISLDKQIDAVKMEIYTFKSLLNMAKDDLAAAQKEVDRLSKEEPTEEPTEEPKEPSDPKDPPLVIEKEEVEKVEVHGIPNDVKQVFDDKLPEGEIVVDVIGYPGLKEVTYYTDGTTSEEVLEEPLTRVERIGTNKDLVKSEDGDKTEDVEVKKEEAKKEEAKKEEAKKEEAKLPETGEATGFAAIAAAAVSFFAGLGFITKKED